MEVALEPATLTVAPGAVGTATVRVRNPGPAAVTCRLAVATAGVADWAWVAPPELTVAAGGTATARLSVKVPPPPKPAAGPVPFEVQVGPVRYPGVVDVLPVANVTAAVGPPHVLTVRNQGNVAVTAALEGDDGALVTPGSVTVEPGCVATAAVKARAGRTFQVHVRPDQGPAVTAAGTMPRRRWARWPVLVPVALVVLLVAGLLARGGGDSAARGADEPEDVSGTIVPPDPSCPLNTHLAADFNGLRRAGVPVPDQWSFLEPRSDRCNPVRFNPCEPIHYVTNSALAPAGALQDLEAAFAQLSQATGITFVNDGPTDEPALSGRPAIQAQRYGRQWAPILVIWDHGRANRLDTDNPGGGRATNINGVYVSGFLLLNVDAVDADGRALANGFGPGPTWGRVMIHELGHIMGLGHVASPQQIMFDDLGIQRGRAEYHAGDLAGLKVLGREGGCVETPRLP
ncbi:MAG: matrixin family metalloprotease [Acidimicrobiales bacterium]